MTVMTVMTVMALMNMMTAMIVQYHPWMKKKRGGV